ncbi:hypothetical protein [Paraburkholderia saeva]|uniref:hypothetical protein n=1 Tax=Paraburkholderia saeva TaxID=2777537 RepID=UPI001E2C171E|nr:hypothetical protein [Paraburkholderia saeva]
MPASSLPRRARNRTMHLVVWIDGRLAVEASEAGPGPPAPPPAGAHASTSTGADPLRRARETYRVIGL